MAEEYYVREADAETARGPYNLEKLSTLAEAGKISLETLVYDDAMEAWISISSNEGLKDQIFPEKKRLSLRTQSDEEMGLLNEDDAGDEEEEGKISVQDMLAAAEGKTEDTRYTQRDFELREKAASLCLPILGASLFFWAIANILPHWKLVARLFEDPAPGQVINYYSVFYEPLLVVGFVDLILSVLLFLSVTEIFRFIRLRMLLGIGFYGFYYYSQAVFGADYAILTGLLAVLGSVAVYITTMTLRYYLILACGIVSILSVWGFLWISSLSSIIFG